MPHGKRERKMESTNYNQSVWGDEAVWQLCGFLRGASEWTARRTHITRSRHKFIDATSYASPRSNLELHRYGFGAFVTCSIMDSMTCFNRCCFSFHWLGKCIDFLKRYRIIHLCWFIRFSLNIKEIFNWIIDRNSTRQPRAHEHINFDYLLKVFCA